MDEGTRGRVIRVADASEEEVQAWRELAENAAEPNPFFEPEFVLPAAAHIEAARETVLVVSEAEGGWSACIPARLGRWRRAVDSVWGLRTPYTYLTTPLVRAGDESARVAALLADAREATGKRNLVLERYCADCPVGAALRESIARGDVLEAASLSFERAMLRRRDSGEYLGWMSKKHLRDLRRRMNRLQEEAGAEIEVLDVSGDPDSAQIFLALEASGWKGRDGTAMGCDEGHAEFFRETCERFRSQGRLEMLALRAGDDVIAMLCNLRSGEGSFSFKIAHDETYAKFSPGIQLEMANAEFFHESGSAWMDSCAEPDNAMINRLWPERRAIRTSVFAPADARGKMLRAALTRASATRQRVRRRS
jgi:CelD/BcsL family acetyltransferase involved in cellulose biosynthesis